MRRVSLYSNSPRSRGASPAESSPEPEVTTPAPIGRQPSRVTRLIQRAKLPLAMIAGALLALTVVFVYGTSSGRAPRQLTQKDIDAAVLRTLETKPLPSRAAQAYDVIKGSVVRVRGLGAEDSPEKDVEHSVGTGVVILEDGTILTNLHVVAGAQRVGVVFADGLQAVATVIATRPEHDLAVI
ncbi:MAG: S1C family serine protease, partial [Pseudomonadota bacterium]